MKKITALFIFILIYSLAHAQLYTSLAMQHASDTGTRSQDGKPGKNYWQNEGDYDIDISFNPKTNLLSGEETISCFNNSPDILTKLIIRLYPDCYKKRMESTTVCLRTKVIRK